MRKRIKYTHRDLRLVKKAYNDNFELLYKAVDTPLHSYYLKIEMQLYRKELRIRRSLGLLNLNQCPLTTSPKCENCTGRYKKFNAKHNKEYKVLPVTSGGRICRYINNG